jgi:hypothetical protein
MAISFLNCNQSRQNPRPARKRRRGRFTDKGTPEVIPGRKAKAFEVVSLASLASLESQGMVF